jgi:hypothetical protein
MLDQPLVFGILEDFTEVQILPKDLGLNLKSFRHGLVFALHQGNEEAIRKYVESLQRRRFKKLTALRLENHRWVLSKTGLKLGQIEVLKIIHLNSLVEKK